MNMKRVGLGSLVVTLLCLGLVRGEDLSGPYNGPSAPIAGAPEGVAEAPLLGVASPLGEKHSSWLAYPRCQGCCGPVGRDGPIAYEVYLRNGFNFTVGDNPFGARLATGWDVTAGARTLFFNPEADRAWAVDLGVTNIVNKSNDTTTVYPFTNLTPVSGGAAIPVVNTTIKSLNRTYVNLSGGREWYLWGSADCAQPENNLRVGVDLGSRYGTEKLDVTGFTHLSSTNYGLFLAVHSDVEIPLGTCIFTGGIRGEYGNTWSSVIQGRNSDIQDINFLFTLGVRF